MLQYAYENCPVCGKTLRDGFEWSIISAEREAVCPDCDLWATVTMSARVLTKILMEKH